MGRLKFGIQMRVQDPPDGEHIVRRWQESLEAAAVAESCGFDGVFVGEHHMQPDGYLPSPWAALGALAARTERIEIGVAVHLLPLNHPIHVAEASAIADILSEGRLRLGCGLANFAPEFELFGLDKSEQVSRYEESLDLLQRAWAGEDIDHDGEHFKVKGRISPLPVGAQLWLGAMSAPGVRRAARFACPWVTDSLHNVDVLADWAEIYRKAGAAQGTADRCRVLAMREGWVADSLEEVEETWWPYVRAEHWFYFQKVPRFVADREPTLRGLASEEDFVFDQHHRDRLIVGSPAECIEKIRTFRERLGLDYMILSFRLSHGPSFEQELACLERFGKEVIPAFEDDE